MLIVKSFKTSSKIENRAMKSRFAPIAFIILVGIVAPILYYSYFCYFKIETEVRQCKYITVQTGGRIGNHLLQYMHLYIQWKKNEKKLKAMNFTPIIPEEINQTMSDLFEKYVHESGIKYPEDANFSISTINGASWNACPSQGKPIYGVSEDISDYALCVLQGWLFAYPEVVAFGFENIRKELQFRNDLLVEIHTLLVTINLGNVSQPTFVCMHYRGNDYLPHLRNHIKRIYSGPPTSRYYILAMEYFKERYKNVLFVFLTTDFDWLKKNSDPILKQGFVVFNPIQNNDPIKDFLLMATCNHTIISYGSYATIAALFAGGETVAYAMYKTDVIVYKDYGEMLTAARHMQKTWLIGDDTYIGKYEDFYV